MQAPVREEKTPVEKTAEADSEIKETVTDNANTEQTETTKSEAKEQAAETVAYEDPVAAEIVPQEQPADQGANEYQYGQNYNQQKPLNWVPYLVLSIISTVCCCLPFGIVAIVFSAKINSAIAAGDMEEAQHAAKLARIWIIVAFAVGIVVNIITFLLGMTGMVGEYYYY